MSLNLPNSVLQYPSIASGSLIQQPGSVRNATREGLFSLKVSFIGSIYDCQFSPLRNYKSAFTYLPSLLLYSSQITELGGGIGRLECEFRGLDPSLRNPPPPVWSLQKSLSNEPIQTHPKWTTEIAGTAQDPLNGAIFLDKSGNTAIGPTDSGGSATYYDNSGKTTSASSFQPVGAAFVGWADGSLFVGVEDYLSASTTLTKTYTDYQPPDLSQVGTFNNTPSYSINIPSDYQWFYMGASFTDEAGILRIEESWKLMPNAKSGDSAATIIYGSN